VTVTFAVTGGGGAVTGASIVTDSTGIATVGSWTLGLTAGPNTLTASSSGLSAVTFNASGAAGAAAVMVKTAGDNQLGSAGAPLGVAPAVTVRDAGGNPKPGVVVTFAVASGGGSVTGGTATSNASGVATVGSWSLGAVPGLNTLTASSPGLPTVTFSATALNALCSTSTPHSLGATTGGALATSDCQLGDGTFVDFFSTALPAADAYLFRQSAEFDTYLFLSAPDGSIIADNDDESDTSRNSAIKALLPPGSFIIGASSYDPLVTGDYTISSATTSTAVTGCELVFVVKNVTTAQNVETTDCLATTPPAAPIYADGFFIFLRAGQSITVSMTSPIVDSFIDLVRLDPNPNNPPALVASNDNRDGTTKDARITYTATVTTYYSIFARTAVASQTGPYNLTIQ
jgi:hypothetical protein